MTTMTDPAPSTDRPRRWWRRPAVLIPLAAVVTIALVVGLLLFQPWKLVIDDRVDEALPSSAVAEAPSGEEQPAAPPRKEPVVLATGSFISHEHGTSGKVRILRLTDGQRILRIENLDTSNGPDLKVWLADAPVIEGTGGWFVFDDGPYVSLGDLKGNVGNQNYPIPDSVDLSDYRSVSIWCERFRVSFGAAELERT